MKEENGGARLAWEQTITEVKFCSYCGTQLALKNIGEKERLACQREDCSYVFWDNPLPVVAALIEYDGKVLLARNKAWPEKIFALITGFLEKGETPEAAIEREIREELNLDVKAVSLIGLYAFFEQNQLIIAYHVVCSGSITLGDELAETKLIPAEKLRPWPFGTGLAVRDWLEKRKNTPATQ